MRLAVALVFPVLAAVLLLPPPAARAAAVVYVELNPSTVRAGDTVSVRASCDDNLKAAAVSAAPIGSVTVEPQYGFLTATATVPVGHRAGDYPVTLHCPDGRTATATLHVVARVEPSRGPATGGGGTAPERIVPLLVGGGLVAMVAGAALGLVSIRRRRVG
ncbi:hypothetical protein ACWT_1200 [Actinoplanes sp. SE50]|uniref:hypothetical protein n=1 Tax=unclassified Actinoplanes TaxID=2626549 RepID=UPI0009B11978|nr:MULTISPECIES: hypothetical protein [unclassified Actinoplanes]ATO80615.1 hypothetical protein ACWT_1200 [Actinoplanes sp. SE50]SLL98021.1 hypothetical protein ACSP50_1238 [Actinoplanes sp. SE50/110]